MKLVATWAAALPAMAAQAGRSEGWLILHACGD